MLVELLSDEVASVRRAAVKNVTITDHMLQLALHDPDIGIVAYARLLVEENTDA
jgi:uncharacterized protein YpbB